MGMIDTETLREICYAVDEEGRYVLTPSAGWEPKNIANDQAWEMIRGQVSRTRLRKSRSGKLSPLAYHMARHQMTLGLLAKYVGYSRFRVWQHLKPPGFGRLTADILRKYADVFEVIAGRIDAGAGCMIASLAMAPSVAEDLLRVDFEHRQSSHCESGVAAGLLSHYGIPLSEAMAFGIGAGLFFAYLPFTSGSTSFPHHLSLRGGRHF